MMCVMRKNMKFVFFILEERDPELDPDPEPDPLVIEVRIRGSGSRSPLKCQDPQHWEKDHPPELWGLKPVPYLGLDLCTCGSSAHHLGTSQAEEGQLAQFLVPGGPSRLQDLLSISTCEQDSGDWSRVCFGSWFFQNPVTNFWCIRIRNQNQASLERLFGKIMHFVTKSGTKTSINDVQVPRETYSTPQSYLNSKFPKSLFNTFFVFVWTFFWTAWIQIQCPNWIRILSGSGYKLEIKRN